MRVFDFEGMLEGIAEMRAELEASTMGPPPRGTVADSQQDDDDEMLLLPDAVPEASHTPPRRLTEDTECGMLVIDTLTQVMGPLLKANYTQGIASPLLVNQG